jgi:hypothetical protein
MFSLQPVTAVTLAAAAVVGLVLSLLASLKWALTRRPGLVEGGAPAAFRLLNLVLIPFFVLAGLFVDSIGATAMVIVSSLAVALGLFGLGLHPNQGRSLAAVLLTALGVTGLFAAAVVLMPYVLFASSQNTASLNAGFVFVALGALVALPLVDLVIDRLAWRQGLGVLAVLCLAPAVLASLAGRDLSRLQPATTSTGNLLGEPALWFACLVAFFYAPLEGGISVWATAYLQELGRSERRGIGLLTMFWAGFLVARLSVAFLQQVGNLGEGWDVWLLVMPALLAAAVLGNLVNASTLIHNRLGTLALGLLLGPILPTLLAHLFSVLHSHGVMSDGVAFGLTMAFGSLGALAFAPLFSTTPRGGDSHVALRLPILLALLLTAATFVFWTVG